MTIYPSYLRDTLKEYDVVANFKEVFDIATAEILSVVGKRKKLLDYVFVYKDYRFTITHNRTMTPRIMIDEIMFQILKKTNIYYHFNIERRDEFKELLGRFIGYSYSNGVIYINFLEEDLSWKNEFIDEINEYINQDIEETERFNSIEGDFTNYMVKEKNKELDMEKINKYIDILIKYQDKIHLDLFRNVSMNYYHGSSCSTISSSVLGHPEMIKSELNKLIDIALSRTSDVIGVIPEGLGKIADGVDIDNINFLSFKTILNDNAIAVKKHLDEERGRGIMEYYASKPSGSYVGD